MYANGISLPVTSHTDNRTGRKEIMNIRKKEMNRLERLKKRDNSIMHRRQWEDNIKIDLREIGTGIVDSVNLAKDVDL
jgi:hypothetical protein